MSSEQKKNQALIWGLGLFFLLTGLAMVGFGVFFISENTRAGDWPETEGRILNVAVRSSRGTSSSTQSRYTHLTYSYVVDGESFTSSRFRLGDGPNAGNEKMAEQWSTGDSVKVYYDPGDPSSAVLRTDGSWGVYVPLILGLFFAGVGGLLIVGLVRNPR